MRTFTITKNPDGTYTYTFGTSARIAGVPDGEFATLPNGELRRA